MVSRPSMTGLSWRSGWCRKRSTSPAGRQCNSSRRPTAWKRATSIGGEYQVGQETVRHGVVPTLGGGLLRIRLYQHVVAIQNTRSSSAHREHNVIYAGAEIAKPPRLACRVLAQQRRHSQVTLFPLVFAVRQHDRGVAPKTGGMAAVMVRLIDVPVAIHATSASVPIRQMADSSA